MSSEILLKKQPLASRESENGEAQSGQPNQAADEIAIRIRNLSKCYHLYDRPEDRLKQILMPRLRRLVGMEPRNYAREFWALRDVSFEVNKGEAVGIIGRNGAGKSTLLQLICGTLTPTGGSVDVTGTVAALLELGSGFNPEFTGRENVYMNASVLGLTSEEINDKFDEIAAFADIGEFLEQPTKTYSSGMLTRLAFAVNACIEPQILIVDEALGVGDAPFQSKCYKRLRKLLDNGTTVLFVSHDIATVRTICGRALWVKNGRTELWGDAKEVSKEYERFCWQEQGVTLKASSNSFLYSEDDDEGGNLVAHPETNGNVLSSVPAILFDPNPIFEQNRLRSRIGTGAVIIRNFLVMNEAGEVVTACDYDEQIKVYAYLVLCDSIDSQFVFAVRLRDLKGTFVYSINDFSMHRIRGIDGDKFVASFSMRLPLHHQQYVISTAVFGFQSGNAYVHGAYDFSQAVIWDSIDDAAYIAVKQYRVMPLAGPVHVSAELQVQRIGMVRQ